MEYNPLKIDIDYALKLIRWYVMRISDCNVGDPLANRYLDRIIILQSIFYPYLSDKENEAIDNVKEKY